MTRLEAEQIISILTGGSEPSDGYTIMFSVNGWVFARVGGTIKLEDGTLALPSLAFDSETDLGIFRFTTGVLASGVLGISKKLYVKEQIRLGNGDATNPAITFEADDDLGFFRESADVTQHTKKFHNVGELELDGDLNHDGTKVGLFSSAPAIQQAAPTISGAYSGIDNAQVGTVYAQLTDLNDLRQDLADLVTALKPNGYVS